MYSENTESGFVPWQVNNEFTSVSFNRFNFYGSIMAVDYVGHITQSQSISLGIMKITCWHPEELFKDPAGVFCGYPNSGISYRKQKFICRGADVDCYFWIP